jgi:hypothetical protein
MSEHALQDLLFISTNPERWEGLSDISGIKRQLTLAVLAHCELTEATLGFYKPPKEVRNVHLTLAAADQIHCMWHGHRSRGHAAPPSIPLKVYVTGCGQDVKGNTWADIEVHPCLSNWDAPD